MPHTTRALTVLILVITLFGQSLSLAHFSKLTKLSGQRFSNPSSTFSGVVDVVCCQKCQTKDGCIAVNVNDVDSTCEVIMNVDSGPGAVIANSPGWTMYYLQNPATCLESWTEYNGDCYITQAAYMNWNDADDGCAALHSSATLTDIKTSGQQQFIGELIANTSEPLNHWIGGALDNTGSWTWRDSSRIADGYTNWGLNQPEINTENCVFLYYANAKTWHDGTCAGAMRSICKYEM